MISPKRPAGGPWHHLRMIRLTPMGRGGRRQKEAAIAVELAWEHVLQLPVLYGP